jgi:putative peptidoglycan lipid II flippase
MAAVLVGLEQTIFPALAAEGGALRGLGLAVLVGGGMLAYGVAGQALGAFDLRETFGRLRRRRAAQGRAQG